ncbi:MAG TPA: hypothetical protein VHG30_04010 [Microvirga sp.]|nr:hypothetical protein [Microvirga sp.]
MPARTVVSCALSLALAAGAQAHHPGSHARREGDGRVRLEVVAAVADSCTAVADVRPGTPPGVVAPPGSMPVTAGLRRDGGPCVPRAAAIRSEHVLEAGANVRQVHLYILSPEGALAATERVPVR